MTTSKLIRDQLMAKMPERTLYNRIKAIKKKAYNSISDDVALDVLADQEAIDVYSILKKEGRTEEIVEFRDAVSKFNFNGKMQTRKSSDLPSEPKDERSPYDLPLTKYELDPELANDCRMHPPYRKAVSEAFVTLETRMKKTLNLPDSCIGVEVVEEARKKGVFKSSVPAEEQGLNMLYKGVIMSIRNPAAHRKVEYTRDDAMKIILFTDYLIRLFEDLVKVNCGGINGS